MSDPTPAAVDLSTLGAWPQRVHHRLPVDEVTLAELRDALSGTLDPAYEEFLQEHGGQGFAELVMYDLPPGCPWGAWAILTELFGRFDDGLGDLLVELKAATSVLGRGWLPIGRDPGGNLLVLRAAPPGGVWFWDHEGRPAAGLVSASEIMITAQGERLYLVARSFGAFLAGLRARPWDS